MWTTQKSYAKINLYLEIIGRKSNGYHELWTLFQAVNVADTLKARVIDNSSEIRIVTDKYVTETVNDNLIYKAAKILQIRYNVTQGIEFELEKILPVKAGLGGGSSNAATALQLCNQSWNLNLSEAELRKISLELGADVSFFLSSTTAIGEGFGEKLTLAPSPFPFFVVILTPKVESSTKEMFQSFCVEGKKSKNIFKQKYTQECQNPDFYRFCYNDFETVSFNLYPDIKNLYLNMHNYKPVHVGLCGSGASLFALFQDFIQAQKVVQDLQKQCRFTVLTHFRRSFS